MFSQENAGENEGKEDAQPRGSEEGNQEKENEVLERVPAAADEPEVSFPSKIIQPNT